MGERWQGLNVEYVFPELASIGQVATKVYNGWSKSGSFAFVIENQCSETGKLRL